MKSCLDNSYYMGLSYRSTHRPSLQLRPKSHKEMHNSSTFSLITPQEQQRIIHAQKNRKRTRQIARHYNPFIIRKQTQSREKRRKGSKGSIANIENQDLFKITCLSKVKTEGSEINGPGDDNFAISIVLPDKIQKTKFFNEDIIRVELEKNAPKPRIVQNHKQQSSIFNHFPSKLSLKKSPLDQKLMKSNKNIAATRLSNFFFPSNRVKTQNQRSRSRCYSKLARPSSCKPRKKSLIDSRLFNFDGTLENHRLVIPERPKTADICRVEKKPMRDAQYLNYVDIAKRCIKMKESKKIQKADSMEIQPWNQTEQKIPALFDISCSSIKDQLSREL